MKIIVSTPRIEVNVVNDDNEYIYSFRAENYEVTLNTEAGIKAAKEINEQIKKLLES